jgi:hypothetical protein
MKTPLSALATTLVLMLAHAAPALAETVSCPDPAGFVQAGRCPTEDELLFTFDGFCSDDARMYRQDTDPCVNYPQYRRMKNIALWESADGAFSGYVSCDLPASELRGARIAGMAIARDGKVTRLLCKYDKGLVFAHRTTAACRPEGDGSCSGDPAACKANCEPRSEDKQAREAR